MSENENGTFKVHLRNNEKDEKGIKLLGLLEKKLGTSKMSKENSYCVFMENLEKFVNKRQEEFPKNIEIYIARSMSLRSKKEHKDTNTGTRIGRAFHYKETERNKTVIGCPIEFADIICAFATNNIKETFFSFYDINTIDDLHNRLTPFYKKKKEEIQKEEDIYGQYKGAPKKQQISKRIIEGGEMTDGENALEESDDLDSLSSNYLTGSRTGKEISNKWRFLFPDKKAKPHSKKIWEGLKQSLKLGKSNEILDHVSIIYEKLDKFIWDCREDVELLGNKKLQEHVEQKNLFPGESSVIQLFDKTEVNNEKKRENGGNDLFSLDVLACFIAGEPTTIQTYLGLEKASDLGQFLTKHYKTTCGEFKKNLEGKNFDDICEQGFWYENIETKEDVSEDTHSKYNGKFLKKTDIAFILIILLGLIICLAVSYNNPLSEEIIPTEPPCVEKKDDSAFRIGIACPINRNGKGDFKLDMMIEKELLDSDLENKYIRLDIINNDNICFKGMTKRSLDKRTARDIANDIDADLMIWSEYVEHDRDSVTFALYFLWNGNFKMLYPAHSPQINRPSFFPEDKRLNEFRDSTYRNIKLTYSLNANDKDFQGFSKDIQSLIKWVTFLQLRKQNNPIGAFHVLKSDYENHFSRSLLISCLFDFPEIVDTFNQYYNILKIENGYMYAAIAGIYYNKWEDKSLSVQKRIEMLNKAFYNAEKVLLFLKDENYQFINSKNSVEYLHSFDIRSFAYGICATYYDIVESNYFKAIELINKAIELINKAIDSSMVAGDLGISFHEKNENTNGVNIPSNYDIDANFFIKEYLRVLFILKQEIQFRNGAYLDTYKTGLDAYIASGFSAPYISLKTSVPSLKEIQIYAKMAEYCLKKYLDLSGMIPDSLRANLMLDIYLLLQFTEKYEKEIKILETLQNTRLYLPLQEKIHTIDSLKDMYYKKINS